MNEKIKLISGNSNRPLAQKISSYLKIPLCDAEIKRFSDQEISVKINENIRGTDVFIIQSTNPPAENLLELLVIIDAARRASAERISAVIPYYAYARQDRKDQPRVPITSKLVANLIAASGADRVLTMDLHAVQIQGFFDIPLDHLFANPVFYDFCAGFKPDDWVVLADLGSIKMVRNFAKKLSMPFAVLDKKRHVANQVEILNVIGEVEGKNVIIRDDIVDTAGTLTQAADFLVKQGAREIYACCTHAVLSGRSLELIEKSPLKKVVVSDTIDQGNEKLSSKYEIASVSKIFGEAIKRIHMGESVSSLFEY
ncbi:MAG: ribose-phosphate pyrophosphokinase [candidate division Zixibacteria bacterium SM23_73_3]|nr:MAG: ribose-phosphate pyrophosphokinase [candidate division Zixibacteria bacterium SM23_73_3]